MYKNRLSHPSQKDMEIMQENVRALGQTLEQLGDTFELVEIGDAATFDGLKKELDINERLDAAIARCLKQLLLVRGVKSISAAPPSASPKHLPGRSKAC
jgi:ATP phosphoribosyltransferase regulatory subunit HisZ